MSHWSNDGIFYHIYPLGLCGAPETNDFVSPPVERLDALIPWVEHAADLGVTALYIGPLFESTRHGYDTADYFHVDRRLGSNETLARLSAAVHAKGLRLILDAVFNHVGRDFLAFKDLSANGERSAYADWFHGLSFGKPNAHGDPFSYEGWSGHTSLVKLNLKNSGVRDHLFEAVDSWVREYGIDGLRLDAADVIDVGFLKDLAAHCRRLRPDFWLLGEIVHGDYRKWVNPETLDSVTNYECYKGLYSSHVDKNYFEIAYSLNRQFGSAGIYRGMPLYSFADNHDVNRVASSLKNPGHLYPLYCLLFTMPGVPSVYYGSEWGIEGKRDGTDRPLRPYLDLGRVSREGPHVALAGFIAALAKIRRQSAALKSGDYAQLHVSHEQFAFSRASQTERIIVAVNAADRPEKLSLKLADVRDGVISDLLNPGDTFQMNHGRIVIDPLPPFGGRILKLP